MDGQILYISLIKVTLLSWISSYFCKYNSIHTLGPFIVIDKFIILSISSDSIIISWDVIPRDNSTLTLSITDSHQTINNTINVTGDMNIYKYTEQLSPCNVYTFKLILPTSKSGCRHDENIKVISTGKIKPIIHFALTIY